MLPLGISVATGSGPSQQLVKRRGLVPLGAGHLDIVRAQIACTPRPVAAFVPSPSAMGREADVAPTPGVDAAQRLKATLRRRALRQAPSSVEYSRLRGGDGGHRVHVQRNYLPFAPGAPHLHSSRRRPGAGLRQLDPDAGWLHDVPNQLSCGHVLRARGSAAVRLVPTGAEGELRDSGIEITESEGSDWTCRGCKR
jgi:hypothetical protein